MDIVSVKQRNLPKPHRQAPSPTNNARYLIQLAKAIMAVPATKGEVMEELSYVLPLNYPKFALIYLIKFGIYSSCLCEIIIINGDMI